MEEVLDRGSAMIADGSGNPALYKVKDTLCREDTFDVEDCFGYQWKTRQDYDIAGGGMQVQPCSPFEISKAKSRRNNNFLLEMSLRQNSDEMQTMTESWLYS